MIVNTIKEFFTSRISPADSIEPTEHAVHLAAAALLLEVSRADFEIGEHELAVIADALKNHFAFSDEEVQELLKLGLAKEKEAVSMHSFLRLINDHFTPEQKRQILEDMWRVAFADGRLDKYEEGRIRKIADLLYLPHKDFIRTKLRVRAAPGDQIC
jgi:uncharacterized tellurite resistance protein B-like protein